jgi:hypothetical protein
MSFELPNLDDFETQLAADINEFEQNGGDATRPVLAEGYYPALLKEIGCRFGITTKVNKSNPKGEPKPYFMLTSAFTVDSAIARETLRQDNNPTVFDSGSDSIFLPAFFDTSEYGFSIKTNPQLWYWIGGILSQVDLATLTEQDGVKSFTIDKSFLDNVFNDAYKAEVTRLYGLAKAGERISDDDKLNDYMLIPAMLASFLLKNISDLLTQDEATSRCVVLVARREYNKEKQHYVKNYILQSKAEEYEDRIMK